MEEGRLLSQDAVRHAAHMNEITVDGKVWDEICWVEETRGRVRITQDLSRYTYER